MANSAVWTGVISFGLINIPVRFYNATPKNSFEKVTKHPRHLPF